MKTLTLMIKIGHTHTHTNGKVLCTHKLEELMLLKCPHYPKQSMQCYENSNGIFHRNKSNNPKICTEPQKISNSKSSLEKEQN